MKNKKQVLFILMFLPFLGFTQAQTPVAGGSNEMISSLENIVALMALLTIIVAILALTRVTRILMQTQLLRIYEEEGIEAMVEEAQKPQKSIWKWLMEKLTDRVPMEKEQDILLAHNYDGIRELDNSLPPWWTAMFYISIVFSIIYFGYYHVLDRGHDQITAYEEEMEIAEKARAIYVAQQADLVNENTITALVDQVALEEGKTIYMAYCLACHGALGEGGVGPNFTDNYWIHGGDIKDVFKTIKYGVPEKGMISWSTQLPAADMHKVASFILTLVGTNPPNGKAPEGELYEPNTSALPAKDAEKALGSLK